jgi:hypothetical protein
VVSYRGSPWSVRPQGLLGRAWSAVGGIFKGEEPSETEPKPGPERTRRETVVRACWGLWGTRLAWWP